MKPKVGKKIRVLMADDHPLLLSGFVAELGNHRDIDVVGTAATSELMIDAFRRLKPDVLVADLNFSNSTVLGIEAIRTILHEDDSARIVILTMHDQDRLITEAYRIGVMAYMLKSTTVDKLITAIRAAAEGNAYMMPEISQRIAMLAVHGPKNPVDALPEREFQIFKLKAEGKTNIEIAKELNITVRTVANVLYTVKQKLGAHTDADLTLQAVAFNIIQTPHPIDTPRTKA